MLPASVVVMPSVLVTVNDAALLISTAAVAESSDGLVSV